MSARQQPTGCTHPTQPGEACGFCAKQDDWALRVRERVSKAPPPPPCVSEPAPAWPAAAFEPGHSLTAVVARRQPIVPFGLTGPVVITPERMAALVEEGRAFGKAARETVARMKQPDPMAAVFAKAIGDTRSTLTGSEVKALRERIAVLEAERDSLLSERGAMANEILTRRHERDEALSKIATLERDLAEARKKTV